MRTFLFLSTMFLLVTSLVVVISFPSCTKEGPPGKAGEDGIDGESGTATCAVCHDDSQVNTAITRHWEKSKHASGSAYLRNSSNCAGCHTSQGYRELLETGSTTTFATISNPNPPNCYTCHQIHQQYTLDDWDLTNVASFDLRITGDHVDHGKGNLCASCHQPRRPSPMPVIGGSDITIDNFRWGPHYGSPGALAAGKGGYEIGSGYTNSAHVSMIDNSCVTCHMPENYNEQAGGHMFNLSYGGPASPDVLTSSCTGCHTNETTLQLLMDSAKLDINTLLADLNGELKTIGILSATDQPVSGTWTANQAGALLNHQLVKYDGSNGVHNYPYIKTLLENSIAAIQ